MRGKIERLLADLPSPGGTDELPRHRRIFVNRNLHMGHVDWLGFDLDHTLACYDRLAIEEAAFEITKVKLVEEAGYPEAVLGLFYEPDFMIRGLVIDTERGNVLKLDRYAYVKLAYHGKHPLPRSERKRIYSTQKVDFATGPALDTLFAIPEACVFAQLVDLADRDPARIPHDYVRIQQDIRRVVDKAHRDDTLKKRIRADLARFFNIDPELVPMLVALRQGGKRLFLLTNSYWAYTNTVLSHLCSGQERHWLELFDCIVVGACKPAFYTSNAPFLEVDTESGMLRNVDREELRLGRVYQGGNAELLEGLLGASGEKVVYFGDHIYGDILRSKKALGWRTGLVIEELEQEIQILEATRELHHEMAHVDRARRCYERARDRAATRGADTARLGGAMLELQRHAGRLFRDSQAAFNPYWGELFRAGKEISLFGHQVEGYACLYTSRLSNFLSYPIDKYFRCHGGTTPHDPTIRG